MKTFHYPWVGRRGGGVHGTTNIYLPNTNKFYTAISSVFAEAWLKILHKHLFIALLTSLPIRLPQKKMSMCYLFDHHIHKVFDCTYPLFKPTRGQWRRIGKKKATQNIGTYHFHCNYVFAWP